jgi:hypothetical protein
MGGFGSGRPGWRPHLEACQVLDVNQLRRREDLTRAQEMRIKFQVRDVGGECHDVAQTIQIDHVPCPFGNSRPHFICPGRPSAWCGARVSQLYSRGSLFLCRRCHNLRYSSEKKDKLARAQRAAGKIKARAGGSPDVVARFPRRPKYMQEKTYRRLRQRYDEAGTRADDVFNVEAAALFSRLR